VDKREGRSLLAPVDRFDPQPIDVNFGLLTDPPEWQRKAR
jgi:hypothetical protein